MSDISPGLCLLVGSASEGLQDGLLQRRPDSRALKQLNLRMQSGLLLN